VDSLEHFENDSCIHLSLRRALVVTDILDLLIVTMILLAGCSDRGRQLTSHATLDAAVASERAAEALRHSTALGTQSSQAAGSGGDLVSGESNHR